jgi:hypothetical protein
MSTALYSASVSGGLFDASTLTAVQGTNSLRRSAARILAKKGLRDIREALYTLDGVVAGSTATKTNAVVEANVELGGVRAITTENLINRATVTADQTLTRADILRFSENNTFGASPPANLDGNPLGTR